MSVEPTDWAWSSDEGDLVHFRYVIEQAEPTPVALTITAATAYTVLLNGSDVEGGGASTETWPVDFVAGSNAVGVHVVNLLGQGGALVDIEGEIFAVESNDLWRYSADSAQAEGGSWAMAGFDDDAWRSTTSYGTAAEAPGTWTSRPEVDSDAQWIWEGENGPDTTGTLLVDATLWLRSEFDVP